MSINALDQIFDPRVGTARNPNFRKTISSTQAGRIKLSPTMSSINLTSASPQGIIKFNSFLEYGVGQELAKAL